MPNEKAKGLQTLCHQLNLEQRTKGKNFVGAGAFANSRHKSLLLLRRLLGERKKHLSQWHQTKLHNIGNCAFHLVEEKQTENKGNQHKEN